MVNCDFFKFRRQCIGGKLLGIKPGLNLHVLTLKACIHSFNAQALIIYYCMFATNKL